MRYNNVLHSTASIGCLGIFLLLCLAGVLALDAYWLRETAVAWRSSGFPAVQGRMVSSRVVVSGSGDDVTYAPQLDYVYTVQGTVYRGTNESFTPPLFSSLSFAERRIARYPAGATVQVFYDPAQPQRSALRAGLSGGDIFNAPLVLLHLAVLLLLALLIRRTGSSRLQPGGVLLIEAGALQRIRLPHLSAPLVAIVTALAITALLTFALHAPTGGDYSKPLALGCWALVLGSALLLGLRRARRVAEGRFDLVLDRTAQTLTLPPSREYPFPLAVPLRNIAGLQAHSESRVDSDGDVLWSHRVTLRYDGTREYSLPARLSCTEETRDFAEWLGGLLNVPVAVDVVEHGRSGIRTQPART